MLDEFGVTQEQFRTDKAVRDYVHERFAKGFEVYLATGEAPSKALRDVFERVRKWMLEVYEDIQKILGIQLNETMTGIYDRMLATPDEITAEQIARTKIGDLAAEYETLKGRIEDFNKRARELGATGLKFEEQEVLERMKAKQDARKALRAEIKKLVKDINKMAESPKIRWDDMKAIQRKLGDYDLHRRRKSTLDRRAELEAYLRENPDAEDAMDPKDLRYLGTKALNDMSVDDIRELAAEIQEMYEQGRREYAAWEAAAKERSDKLYADLRTALDKRKSNLPPAKTSPRDLKKQYKGVRGALARVKDWTYAATLSSMRFLDWLDGGATKHDGPFARLFGDAFNKAWDDKLRHVFQRRTWMQERLRDLGLDIQDFSKIRARNVAGKDFSVDQIMEIYIGMRNQKKAQAILYGVFGDERIDNPQAVVNDLISRLTDEEKRAAELVAEDHARHADRIERAFVDAFNHGFDREENYTSIHRIEHGSPQGLIDADSPEFLGAAPQGAGIIAHIQDGFTKSRVDMLPQNQTGISLGLFSNWHNDVNLHEHAAAFAQVAKDTAGALLAKNKADNSTIARMVKERFGDEAWKTLVDYFNIAITDEVRRGHGLLDTASNFLSRNMSIAYLCGNLGTVLRQMTSIPRFLTTAGPHRLLAATTRFMLNPAKFLQEVYELDPQMRDRQGSALLKAIRSDPNWGRNRYQRLIQLGFEPIVIMDRWVAAIGWRATYDANLKELGPEKAAREAQRAVALTQQAVNAKDTSRLWRESGLAKLAMVFTSDAAQTFGMTVYDFTQQMRTGQLTKAGATLLGLTLTAMWAKALKDGIPGGDDDSDEEDEQGWTRWTASAFTTQAIESIPLVGKEAMTLYNNLTGKYRGTQYSAIVAPIDKAIKAARIWTEEEGDEESEEEDFNRATWFALEALSLGGVPIPYTGAKRVIQSTNLWLSDDEPAAAALNMVGRRPPRME
jgi:hypothetical protein